MTKYKFQTKMNMYQWIWYVLNGKYSKDINKYNTESEEKTHK